MKNHEWSCRGRIGEECTCNAPEELCPACQPCPICGAENDGFSPSVMTHFKGFTVKDRFFKILPNLEADKMNLGITENTLALLKGLANGELSIIRKAS